MNAQNVLVESLRNQREILDHVLESLESKQALDPEDYAFCEAAAARVGKSLAVIRRYSMDRFVQQQLWGLSA